MAEHRLIAAYLVELRLSVADLGDAEEIVLEAEDHLLEAAARHGEQEALARFGTPSLVAATFIKDARKGAAVPTTFTKRAGLAALLFPVLLGVGAWLNSSSEGTAHGWAVAFEALALPAFLWGILGLRSRHGGLGRVGIAALVILALAAPVSMPFGYGGVVVLAVMLATAFAVLGVGMLGAAVLPPVPVVLFGFTWPVFWVVAALVTLAGRDAGELFLLPVVVEAASFAWLGWAMWREEAVATPGPGPWASAAA